MPSPIVNVTIQATLINLCSCIFATFFTGKQPPVIPLLIFTAFITPPNYLWQGYLEKVFPGYTTRKLNPDGADKEVKSEKKLNVGNTFIKFILDQTIATLVNVVAFLGGVAFLKGATVLECWHVVQQETWPLLFAGYKLWPAVSIISFTLVPVERRTLVGSLVGFGWGVFLALRASD